MRFYVALTMCSKTSLMQTAKGPWWIFELQNCPSVVERCLYCGIVLKKQCDCGINNFLKGCCTLLVFMVKL